MPDEANEYLIQKASAALAADPRIGELGIDIQLVGRDAFVDGIVATTERRSAIGEVLTRELPLHSVHNQVEVEQIHEPSTPEEL